MQGHAFQPAFEIQNLISVVAMVKADFGVTFMPAGIRSLFGMSSLRTLRVGPTGLFREISITRAKGRVVEPAAEALIMALRDGFHRRTI